MTRWIALAPTGVPVPAQADGGPDLPGSVGGSGASWDFDPDARPSGLPDTVEAIALLPVAAHHVDLDGPRIKRTLLLTVRPGTSAETLARFEADLQAMPRHIPTIRSWALSHVQGPSRWTHAWEQEFADEEGLNGPYLTHPYHWTFVDRWFDPEIPGSVVEPSLAHIYRWSPRPVL